LAKEDVKGSFEKSKPIISKYILKDAILRPNNIKTLLLINNMKINLVNSIPHYELIGDPIQNFYQLGLKDKNKAKIVYKDIHNLFKVPNEALNDKLNQIIQNILPIFFKPNSHYSKYLQAYAEGLGIDDNETFYTLMLPEILSMLKKWMPSLALPTLGCSSYFGINDKTSTAFHLRILDFPLNNSIYGNERTICYKLSNMKKIFTYSFSGLPYPSLTSMNEDGLTLALHQKYTDVFNNKGRPIFEITFQILATCSNINEALKVLKDSISITTWGLYLLDKNNNVLEVDIGGNQIDYRKYKLDNTSPQLYFNNSPLKKFKQVVSLPVSMNEFNNCRNKSIEPELKKIKNLDEIKALKLFSKSSSSKTLFKIGPNNPGTINISCMNPTEFTSKTILGTAPKVYSFGINCYKNIFSKIETKHKEIRTNKDNLKYNKCISLAMNSEINFDARNIHNGFHFLQLAIEESGHLPEKYVLNLYYYYYCFLHISDKTLIEEQYKNLKTLKLKLPTYLQQHTSLLQRRIERIYDLKKTITLNDFDISSFKKYYTQEEKLPALAVHQLLKYTSKPRLEIFDIIYPHLSIES